MTLGTFRLNPSELVAGLAGAMWTWAMASAPFKESERDTLSEPARCTVLDRLLALNHQRHAEEVKAGLHDTKKAKPPKSFKPAKPEQTDLF